MKTPLLTLFAALTLSACDSAGPVYITPDSADLTMISVSATSTANITPDRAVVSAGVHTQGRNAREAMLANATLMTDVYEQLEAAGIDRKNVQTSQLSLQPRFDYSDRRSPKIDGYDARNQVTVKSDTIEKVGPMLDALVSAGVNTINNVAFEVKDPKSAKDEARRNAIREAKAKAKDMADAAGVKLGPLLSLSEGQMGSEPPYPVMRMARAESMDASTPISAGEQTISVTVSLSYGIIE